MKIIFLDIDGVLSGNKYLNLTGSGLLDFGSHRIDPANIAKLNTIVARTGAEVVISSSWRIICPLSDIRGWFRERGLDPAVRIISKTPRVNTPNRVRGDEIREWLRDLPEDEKVEFVILDDDGDMAEYMSHLVLVDRETGLSDDDVEKAVSILRGNQQ